MIELGRVPFGFKTAWLAVWDISGPILVERLQMCGAELAGWESVDRSLERGLFLTPAIQGWTLAVGHDLALAHDKGELDCVELSRLLVTEVQCFVSNRTVGLFGWTRVLKGSLLRAFEYLGETGSVHLDLGEPTEAERRLMCTATGQRDDAFEVTEETVLEIAKAWSIDPSTLDGEDDAPGWYGFRNATVTRC